MLDLLNHQTSIKSLAGIVVDKALISQQDSQSSFWDYWFAGSV